MTVEDVDRRVERVEDAVEIGLVRADDAGKLAERDRCLLDPFGDFVVTVGQHLEQVVALVEQRDERLVLRRQRGGDRVGAVDEVGQLCVALRDGIRDQADAVDQVLDRLLLAVGDRGQLLDQRVELLVVRLLDAVRALLRDLEDVVGRRRAVVRDQRRPSSGRVRFTSPDSRTYFAPSSVAERGLRPASSVRGARRG